MAPIHALNVRTVVTGLVGGRVCFASALMCDQHATTFDVLLLLDVQLIGTQLRQHRDLTFVRAANAARRTRD